MSRLLVSPLWTIRASKGSSERVFNAANAMEQVANRIFGGYFYIYIALILIKI